MNDNIANLALFIIMLFILFIAYLRLVKLYKNLNDKWCGWCSQLHIRWHDICMEAFKLGYKTGYADCAKDDASIKN